MRNRTLRTISSSPLSVTSGCLKGLGVSELKDVLVVRADMLEPVVDVLELDVMEQGPEQVAEVMELMVDVPETVEVPKPVLEVLEPMV